MLHDEEWEPKCELVEAQSECYKVADILDVSAVVGDYATKDRFLSDIKHATVLHIGECFYYIRV